MIHVKLITAITAFGSTASLAFVQLMEGESLTQALTHSAGGGALATVATYLILKGRLDNQDQRHEEYTRRQGVTERTLDDHTTVLNQVARDIGELVGEARERRAGMRLTRSTDKS